MTFSLPQSLFAKVEVQNGRSTLTFFYDALLEDRVENVDNIVTMIVRDEVRFQLNLLEQLGFLPGLVSAAQIRAQCAMDSLLESGRCYYDTKRGRWTYRI